jgi:bifunctional DNase/RNase
MGTVRARPAFLVALAVALAAGTVYAVQEWRSLPPGEVEMTVREVVRTSNGRAVLILQERGGERRLPVLVTAQEAGSLERRRLPGAPPTLAFRSIAAMGGKVSAALIDSVDPGRGFRGRVTFSRFLGPAELALRATEAIALALDAGAPIQVTRELLDAAGISAGDLRGAQAVTRDAAKEQPKVLKL